MSADSRERIIVKADGTTYIHEYLVVVDRSKPELAEMSVRVVVTNGNTAGAEYWRRVSWRGDLLKKALAVKPT